MAILEILDVPVSWVLVQFYSFFSLFMDPYSGWTWAASIVGLVILMRIILIPLFVKQIKAQRGLQIIQPQMKEIQKKYAGDRERQSQEMMRPSSTFPCGRRSGWQMRSRLRQEPAPSRCASSRRS